MQENLNYPRDESDKVFSSKKMSMGPLSTVTLPRVTLKAWREEQDWSKRPATEWASKPPRNFSARESSGRHFFPVSDSTSIIFPGLYLKDDHLIVSSYAMREELEGNPVRRHS